MREIPLTQGKVALVDDEDFDYLNQWNWQYYDGYAVMSRSVNGVRVKFRMHREIMKPLADLFVDHINRNGIDNRKENLRICTNAENSRNKTIHRDSSSGYKGVSWHKIVKKWTAQIMLDGKRRYIGYFKTPEDAAKAYDEAANEYFGEFANLNFPKTNNARL